MQKQKMKSILQYYKWSDVGESIKRIIADKNKFEKAAKEIGVRSQ